MPEREAFRRAEERLLGHYGLEARSRYVDLARPKLRARVIESGAGDPVVYVHGGGGFAGHWAPVLGEVPGFRNVAVDRPGCGLSDPFDYRGVSIRQHAVDFLASLLDALELERVSVVANSMGGLWALAFALARPERVSALALVGCPALFPGSDVPFPMRLISVPGAMALLSRLGQRRGDSGRGQLAQVVGSRAVERLPEEMLTCSRLAFGIPGAGTSFVTMLGSVISLGGARRGAGITEAELAKLTQPTLLLWGSRDRFGSVDVARGAASLLPHAELEIVDGGHMPWFDEPKRCGERIREFLERTGS